MKFSILNSHPTSDFSPEEFVWLDQAVKDARLEWERVRRQGDPTKKAEALSCLPAYLFELKGPHSALGLIRRAHRYWKEVGDPGRIATSCAALAGALAERWSFPGGPPPVC